MKHKLILILFSLVLIVSDAFGQTASDIDKKYGEPVRAYSVSEHVWMTPEYAADGQICRASLYAKRISAEANYVTTYLRLWEVLSVFNELAPLNTRGPKKEYFGNTQTSASMAWTTFEYEKVTFSVLIGFDFGSFADMKKKGVPIGGRTPKEITGSDDEFITNNSVKPDMVYIRWNDRKCAGE